MGISTDAIICFGFNLGEESNVPWDADPYSERVLPFFDWLMETIPGKSGETPLHVWAICPIEPIAHCSDHLPMTIISIRGTSRVAKRGFPESFDPAQLIVPQERIDAAKRFCEQHGIEWRTPTWLLCSWWSG